MAVHHSQLNSSMKVRKMATDNSNDYLKNLVPKTLDDIFRKNRYKGRLALATNEELEKFESKIADLPIRHKITHWQIFMIHITTENGAHISSPRLIGRVEESRQSWISSNIIRINSGNGLIETKNSCYQVIGSRVDEAELDLLHICVTLNQWGIGNRFGVPELFY